MSEEIKQEESFKIDDAPQVKKEEPKAEPAQEAKKEEVSQEALDWRNDLPEEMKTHKSLLKFKTKEDIAKAYVDLERKLGAGVKEINPKSSYDDVVSNLSKMLDIKKDEYKAGDLGKEVVEIGVKHALHPEQLQKVVSDYEMFKKSAQEKEYQNKLNSDKEAILQLDKKEELEKNIQAGLSALDMNFSQWKEALGNNLYNPLLIEKLNKLGSERRSDGITQIKEGKSTGGLPSDPEQLKALHDQLDDKARVLRGNGELNAASEVEKEIEKVQAKYAKESQKIRSGSVL